MEQNIPEAPMPPQQNQMPPQQPMSSGQNNTLMAILAYLGILIIVPFLTEAKNDPFVKFHIKQGLVLIIGWVAIWFITFLPVIGFLGWILNLALFVLMILGIINAATGKMQPLPVIGNLANSFNF